MTVTDGPAAAAALGDSRRGGPVTDSHSLGINGAGWDGWAISGNRLHCALIFLFNFSCEIEG